MRLTGECRTGAAASLPPGLCSYMYFIWAFGLWLRSAFAFAFWGHAATLGAGMLIGMLLRRPPPGGGSGKPSISHVSRMVVTVCPVTAELYGFG